MVGGHVRCCISSHSHHPRVAGLEVEQPTPTWDCSLETSSVLMWLGHGRAPGVPRHRLDLTSRACNKRTVEKDYILTSWATSEDLRGMSDAFAAVVPIVKPSNSPHQWHQKNVFLFFQKFCFHDWTILENYTSFLPSRFMYSWFLEWPVSHGWPLSQHYWVMVFCVSTPAVWMCWCCHEVGVESPDQVLHVCHVDWRVP